MSKKQQKKEQRNHLKNYLSYVILASYLVFFTFLYKLAGIFKNEILNAGIFAQFFLIAAGIAGINKLLKIILSVVSIEKQQNIMSMLRIFAYICLFIAFLRLNGIPFEWFDLAD